MNHRENAFRSWWEFWHLLVFVSARAHQHLCDPAAALAALWLIPAVLSFSLLPSPPLFSVRLSSPFYLPSPGIHSVPLSLIFTHICDSQTCSSSLQGARRGQRDGRVPQTQTHAAGKTSQSHTKWVILTHWHSSLTGIQEDGQRTLAMPSFAVLVRYESTRHQRFGVLPIDIAVDTYRDLDRW